MGRRGPAPKPAPLRVLEGNRAHRPVPKEDPPLPGPVDAPAHLSPESRAVWERLAPELEQKGLLRPRYTDSFEVFCDAVVQYRRAADLLHRTGPLITDRDGNVRTNPAGREFHRFAAIMRAGAADFGLTPASLTAIAHGTPHLPESASPARLLG